MSTLPCPVCGRPAQVRKVRDDWWKLECFRGEDADTAEMHHAFGLYGRSDREVYERWAGVVMRGEPPNIPPAG